MHHFYIKPLWNCKDIKDLASTLASNFDVQWIKLYFIDVDNLVSFIHSIFDLWGLQGIITQNKLNLKAIRWRYETQIIDNNGQ